MITDWGSAVGEMVQIHVQVVKEVSRVTISGPAGVLFAEEHPFDGQSLNIILVCPHCREILCFLGCGVIVVDLVDEDSGTTFFTQSSFSIWCPRCKVSHSFDHPRFDLPTVELENL